MKKKVILIFMMLVAVVMTGCQKPEAGKVVFSRQEVIGYSSGSRPINAMVAGDGGDVVMVIAGIHGNEPAGVPLAKGVFRYVEKRSKLMTGRTLVVVPVANPDGYKANRRYSNNGVDINRNFPAANREDNSKNGWQALSEPESQALFELINKYKPDRIVSIHQPLACVDYDGPAEGLAKAMASEGYLPVRKLGSRPGSLGSWAGVEKEIPIVTLELRYEDSKLDSEELWDRYGKMLLAAVVFN